MRKRLKLACVGAITLAAIVSMDRFHSHWLTVTAEVLAVLGLV